MFFVSVFLSADSFEESFARKFVQRAHIQKTGHLFLVFSERGNEIAPAIGFGSRNLCHAFRIEAIGLLQGNAKNPDRRLLKKILEAYKGNGVLEYGNIGVLGFKRSIHHSILPLFQCLLRWPRRLSAAKHMRLFQQLALPSGTKGHDPASPCLHDCIIVGVWRSQQDALDPRRLELLNASRALLRRAGDRKTLQ
jgi:hypothetical protein